MANENKTFELQSSETDFDYEQLLELESSLENNLKDVVEHIDQLDIDREKLQNNEYLQESIENIVWEQVQLQLAAQIGEEFIKENKGQTLDLRKEAHIQTAENFEKGKFATHNRDVDYQGRYTKWQDNFTINKKGERVLKSDAREFFDKGRDKGSGAVHKDHTVSIKEQLNDIEMSTFFSKEEVKEFAISSKIFLVLDASANMSKGDKTMKEFLDSERNGLKPEERFNINRKQLEKDDQEAREELHKRKQENKEKAIQDTLGKNEKADKVLFVIITDGLENASKEYNSSTVKKLIETQKEKYGWEFLFLGANIDAIETANTIGISAERAVNYKSDSIGTKKNYDTLNKAVEEVRSGKDLDKNWKADIEADYNERNKK